MAATLNPRISPSQQNDICFLLTSFILFLLPGPADSLNFSFTKFDSNHANVFLEGDAAVSDDAIQLTTNKPTKSPNESCGRATYTTPLHLYDKASGNLTNFTAHFVFTIDSLGKIFHGDGLTFFRLPNDTVIPPTWGYGGGLGLTPGNNDSQPLDTDKNKFVAVEFDTYNNYWDPVYDHVGIDVRSMRSIANVSWASGAWAGLKTFAWITYDSRNKLLSVNFTHDDPMFMVPRMKNLSAVVDLAEHLPEWVKFGFSASTGFHFQLNSISHWAFSSTSEIVENVTSQSKDVAKTPSISPTSGTAISRGRDRISILLVGGLSVGVCFLLFGMYLTLVVLRKKRGKGRVEDPDIIHVSFSDDFKNGAGPRKFSYEELAEATSNFSEAVKIGEGGFGAVYRGSVKDMNTCYVAVKRVSKGSNQGIKQCLSEVKIISRLRHRNLVRLVGRCIEKELLLAYEFMINGSLDSHLFRGKSLLTWKVRYKVALDLASAILYLHEEADGSVIHRDIKPSNIMLDCNFNAKLGDFGSTTLVDNDNGSETMACVGTRGYMAPECLTSSKATKESDIYSFGVVALEIACGRRFVKSDSEGGYIRLIEWVWDLYAAGKHLEAADPKLQGDFDEQQMDRLMILGLGCAHPDGKFRPTIRQVIHLLLNFEAPLPTLPSPVPSYAACLSEMSDCS